MTAIGNSLPRNKILDWSKLKAFADDNINVTESLKFVLRMFENILGKGEKCWLPAFSSFLTMFQKASLTGSLKVVTVW